MGPAELTACATVAVACMTFRHPDQTARHVTLTAYYRIEAIGSTGAMGEQTISDRADLSHTVRDVSGVHFQHFWPVTAHCRHQAPTRRQPNQAIHAENTQLSLARLI